MIKKGEAFAIRGAGRFKGQPLIALKDFSLEDFLKERDLIDFWEVEVELLGEYAKPMEIKYLDVDQYCDNIDDVDNDSAYRVRTAKD